MIRVDERFRWLDGGDCLRLGWGEGWMLPSSGVSTELQWGTERGKWSTSTDLYLRRHRTCKLKMFEEDRGIGRIHPLKIPRWEWLSILFERGTNFYMSWVIVMLVKSVTQVSEEVGTRTNIPPRDTHPKITSINESSALSSHNPRITWKSRTWHSNSW